MSSGCKALNCGEDRKATDELGNHAVLAEVFWLDLTEDIFCVALGLAFDLGAEADALLADPLADDVLEPIECSANDEQHIGGVDLDELLVWVLASALRRNGRRCAFEDLQAEPVARPRLRRRV